MKRAPMLGGNFCAWMGLFGTFQCMLLYGTGTDSHINQTLAGGLTGATINIRGGWRFALRGGLSGLVFIGVFNLLEIFMMKKNYKSQMEMSILQENFQMYNEIEHLQKKRPDVVEMSHAEISQRKSVLYNEMLEMGMGGGAPPQ